MKQIEFQFAGPPIPSDDERFVNLLNNMVSMFDRMSPNWRQNIREALSALKDVQPMDDNNGPSFPVTIVVGQRRQPEFDFAVQLYKEQWKNFDVKMHCDIDSLPSLV